MNSFPFPFIKIIIEFIGLIGIYIIFFIKNNENFYLKKGNFFFFLKPKFLFKKNYKTKSKHKLLHILPCGRIIICG